MTVLHDSRCPDLGQRLWHQEGHFFHGYINGIYHRMVCTKDEFEEMREQASKERETPLDDEDTWEMLQEYTNPWQSYYGQFESASPFEEDLGFEARRRIIAVNMFLNPDTTTWYGLGKQYTLFANQRYVADRRRMLKERKLALGLTPRLEQDSRNRMRRALAFELGLNPFTATWQDINEIPLELHKAILPKNLGDRARMYLRERQMDFGDLLQKSLEQYLDNQMTD